ncbi:MAG TPA: tripartite tricarboxylate transporter substrate binding protein [Xanthobacteraceae bacterium]|nr:tripartite tricarboxylate transporter substrate binding protein [Xanthobacteraceae bacterium]
MKLPRRKVLSLAASACAFPQALGIAWAQAYPARPVRIMVGFAPGGSADIIARLMAQWLSQRLGQQFIVENRTGAGTNIATEAVTRAPPDGYTLLLITASNFINATLYEKLSFNFIRDIAPIVLLSREPNVMVVHPSVPANTVPEFIALARANPGTITMASGGTGAPSHVTGELFKMQTGVNLVHVPYRGAGPALSDLLGGQVQVYFAPMSAAVEYVRAGQLRALAVTAAARSEALTNVPTVSEFVPGFEASQWYGIGAPRHAPAEIVEKLNMEANAFLSDPMVKARLADLGETALGGSPAQFGKLIAEETEKWGRVVRFSGAKAD